MLLSVTRFCGFVVLWFCASLGASQKRSVMPAQFIYSNLSLFDHFSLTFDVVYDQTFAQGVQFWKLKTIFSMTFVCLTWVASRQMQLCKSNTNAIKVTGKGQQNKIIFVSVPVENSSTCNLMGTNVLLSLRVWCYQLTAHRLKSAFDTFVCYSLLKHSNQITESKVITCSITPRRSEGERDCRWWYYRPYSIITAHCELMKDNGWRLVFISLAGNLNTVNNAA